MELLTSREVFLEVSVFVFDPLILYEVSDQIVAPCAGASQGQPRGLCTCTCGTVQDIDLMTKEGKQVLGECTHRYSSI